MSLFDLTEVTENSGREVLPPGLYRVQVAKAEVKDTQKGGEMIKCEFDVFKPDGEEKIGKLWHNFNTKNSSAKAVEIGLGQLKCFLRVSKFADANHLTDVNDLCGLSAVVKVKVRKSEEFGDANEIENFDPKKAVAAASAGKAAPAANPFG